MKIPSEIKSPLPLSLPVLFPLYVGKRILPRLVNFAFIFGKSDFWSFLTFTCCIPSRSFPLVVKRILPFGCLSICSRISKIMSCKVRRSIHSGSKCLARMGYLWSKIPMFQRAWLREGGKVATPTGFSIFDSCDMKSLWFKFGHDIFAGFKMARL